MLLTRYWQKYLKDTDKIFENTDNYLKILANTEVIVPAVPSYWENTDKILEDTDKVLEDTDYYLEVLATTEVIQTVPSYW
jgi:hypothetical protein